MPVVLALDDLAVSGSHVGHPWWCAKWPLCGSREGRVVHTSKPVLAREDVTVTLNQDDSGPPMVTVQVGQQLVTMTADDAFHVGWVVRWTAREVLDRRRSW